MPSRPFAFGARAVIPVFFAMAACSSEGGRPIPAVVVEPGNGKLGAPTGPLAGEAGVDPDAATSMTADAARPSDDASADAGSDAGTVSIDANSDAVSEASSDASADASGHRVDPRPYAPPFRATIGGQAAWVHDERWASGFFNTFDALAVGGTPRKVHVYLPRGYDRSNARYPVVYMNDGDTTFWNGGAANKTWAVGAVLDDLYARGAIVEVIVVAMHPIEREREYTHVDWAPGRSCCGLPAYAAYVADKVKPFIDGAYRTERAASRTAIVGSSHGGLAAFYMATHRPESFGKAIAMSSSFWVGLDSVVNGGSLANAVLVREVAATLGDAAARPTLWLDWGLVRSGGFHNSWIEERATARGREMAALLAAQYGYVSGASLFVDEDPAGAHDEDSWRRRIGPALTAMFAP